MPDGSQHSHRSFSCSVPIPEFSKCALYCLSPTRVGFCGDDKIGICMFGQFLLKEQFNADVHILRDDAGGLMDLLEMLVYQKLLELILYGTSTGSLEVSGRIAGGEY